VVEACEPYNVKIYVFDNSDDAENENNESSYARVCVGQSYWARVEWYAGDGGENDDEDFMIDVNEGGTVLEQRGPIDDDDTYPMKLVIEVDHASGITAGEHTLSACVGRWIDGDIKMRHCNGGGVGYLDGVVDVVEVTGVSEDKTVACINDEVTFTAYTNPSGRAADCMQWESRYRTDSGSAWGSWDPVDDDDKNKTTVLTTDTAGLYKFRGRNGSGDPWDAEKESNEVAIVEVDKIEMYAGSPRSWQDVTGGTVVVLKGTKYDFKAQPNLSGAGWPSGKPLWYRDGNPIGSGEKVEDVVFNSTTSTTLKAQCCGDDPGKMVTITPIVPHVNSVEYAGSNFALHEVNLPEYKREHFQNEPGCWWAGTVAIAKVQFWGSQDLTFAEPGVVVRAETSGDYFNIGDWGDSSGATFGTSWPTSDITCPAERTINSTVQYRDYTAYWMYKCTNGTDSWVDSNEVSGCRLYVVLGVPTAPQAQPWKDVLDKACQWGWGESQSAGALDQLVGYFYSLSGLTYDGTQSHYVYEAGPPAKMVFDLSDFLSDWDKADCQDAGMFLSCLSASLGCDLTATRRIQGAFTTKSVKAVGHTSWDPVTWNFHHIGWYNNVYDASVQLYEWSPYLAIDDNIDDPYKVDLYDFGTWSPQTPFTLGSTDPYFSLPTEIK
jgi:hypothetical protein